MPLRAGRDPRRQAPLAPASGLLRAGALLLGLSVLDICPGQSDSPTPRGTESRTVTIENLQFTPQTLTVRRGDHVVWVNKDLFPHTVSSTEKKFDSRSIAPNSSWTFVAKASGTFPYACTFHPTMTGTLVVQ
ncbi:MAG TPA: cupredoxin family copper-binding protein [Steroidobacteraceae bacterium]|nr:cupredoxin family copper-binding protein [Steroidobacteraceae bacterium]